MGRSKGNELSQLELEKILLECVLGTQVENFVQRKGSDKRYSREKGSKGKTGDTQSAQVSGITAR